MADRPNEWAAEEAAQTAEDEAEKGPVEKYLGNREQHAKSIKVLVDNIGNRRGLEDLRDLFDDTDANKNGTLDLQEFTTLMQSFTDRNWGRFPLPT